MAMAVFVRPQVRRRCDDPVHLELRVGEGDSKLLLPGEHRTTSGRGPNRSDARDSAKNAAPSVT